jgi:AmmeMemoRadiSam system protein B
MVPPRLRFSTAASDLALVREVVAEIEAEADSSPRRARLRALVAPHLDLAAGRRIYRSAYASLGARCPGRIVILGTGHFLADRPISLSEVDHETRLGCWPTDRDAVRLLREAGGEAVAADDRAYRREHSIAHQLLFLHRLLGARARVPLLPVLLGPVSHHLERVDRLAEIPELEPFLAALAALIDERTLVVASVDLSHVGPRFGDPLPAVDYEPELVAHDHALLEALCRGSVEELWGEARRVADRFRVCGLPVLAALLEILPRARGRVLDHQICHDPSSASAVSCAAVALEE